MENTNIHLSSYDTIDKTVRFDNNDFSFIKTLYGFVNNRQFGLGYERLSDKQYDSYIWEVLSAIGEDLGEKIYSDILRYIEKVSDVDTCKLTSLRSMMKMIDMQYDVLDNVEFYPLEIRNLVDVLSISRGKLFDNRFMNKDFLEFLLRDGVLSKDDATSASENGATNVQFEHYLYDNEEFQKYLVQMFYNFIYDMITMRHPGSDTYVLSTLTDGEKAEYTDGSYQDDYISYKKQYNIATNFDYNSVLNDIEMGLDSLSNYGGNTLSLLVKVSTDRSAPISGKSYLKTTKYAYYRRKKVLEIADFVDNLAAGDLFDVTTYERDDQYWESNRRKKEYVISVDAIASGNQISDIVNTDMIAIASEGLTRIVMMVQSLRQKIRNQVRKIFMKGTNNLLVFTINEFITEYINQTVAGCADRSKIDAISAIYKSLSAHYVTDVEVQEYQDTTEYMNISTETTPYAYNASQVNGRYFDEYFQCNNGKYTVQDPQHFTNGEINNFYLDTLGLNNTLYTDIDTDISTSFYNLLSVLFDTAASKAFYDDEYKIFGTVVDNVITRTRHQDILSVETISSYIHYVQENTGYEFSTDVSLLSAKEDLEDAYHDVISVEYLSSVKLVYDEYYPQVQEISSDLKRQRQSLYTFLSDTYSYYFCKSDDENCYNDDGTYTLEYFFGNESYPIDDYYITYLNNAYNWINSENHCVNWPILCSCVKLEKRYTEISNDLYDRVINDLQQSGYVDLSTEILGDKIADIRTFLKDRIDSREAFLQNAITDFRSQAKELKSTYDSLVTNFNTIMAQLPNTSQGYYFTGAEYDIPPEEDEEDGKKEWLGEYTLASEKRTMTRRCEPCGDENDWWVDKVPNIYDQYTGMFFEENWKKMKDEDGEVYWILRGGKYDKKEFTEVTATNFGDKCSEALELVKQIGEIELCPKKHTSVPGGGFIQAASENAINTLMVEYDKLGENVDTLLDKIEELFQLQDNDEFTSIYGSSDGIEGRIYGVIAFLGSSITDEIIERDVILRNYNEKLDILEVISDRYDIVEVQYSRLWTKFSRFVSDFIDRYPNYGDYTLTTLRNLRSFTRKQDAKELVVINQWFEDTIVEYEKLVERLNQLCDTDICMFDGNEYYIYSGISDVLEECIYDLSEQLEEDVNNKTEWAMRKIDELLQYYDDMFYALQTIYYTYCGKTIGEFKTYSKFIDVFLNIDTKTWADVISEILYSIDYRDSVEYKNSKLMFEAYSGVPQFATDPYYNFKNQTHPSFQIHPFLWNIVEYSKTHSFLELIGTTVTSLESKVYGCGSISKYIDGVIGKFGNMINVWNSDVNDYSGYTTRYESSDHCNRYTGMKSEVVDYDGSFYPLAVKTYIERYDQCVKSGGNFVGSLSAWYHHLNIDGTEYGDQINRLLSDKDIHDRIEDIVSPSDSQRMHDIFKYQLDSLGNIYILFKTYDVENPSYSQKLNTKGELWIRLVDSPIAFPVMKNVSKDSYNGLSNDIYDFEIVPDGNRIVVVYKDHESVQQNEQMLGPPGSDSMKCIALYINFTNYAQTGHGRLILRDNKSNDTTRSSYIQSYVFPSDYGTERGNRFKRYLGMYPRQNNIIDVLFIDHEYDGLNDLGVPDHPVLYRYVVDANTTQVGSVIRTTLSNVDRLTVRQDPPFAFYNSSNNVPYLDLAFVCEKRSNEATVYKNRHMDTELDTEGCTYDDKYNTEMNSYDTLNQDIVIATVKITDNAAANETTNFNVNADMGYIPAYSGLEDDRLLDVADEMGENYQSIELLGRSKNIDRLIDSVNDSPDPYVTTSEILESGICGRVFEDHDETNTSLRIYENPSLFREMPSDAETKYDSNTLRWFISIKDFARDKTNDLRVVIYNVDNLGKNPYLIADLSSVMKKGVDLNYTDSSRFDNVEPSIQIGDKTISFVGTCNGVDQITDIFDNRIDNVSRIYLDYYTDGFISLNFVLASSRNTFIDAGKVKVMIYNMHDFSIFEKYHFLDQYGIVDAEGFIRNEDTGERYPLSSIHLSAFSQLEDVYALSTDKRLQFKYNEEDIFDPSDIRFYVPSLNIRYPYTAAQYVNDYLVKLMDTGEYDAVIHIFDSDNVFSIIGQSEEVISTMTGLDIESLNYDDQDIRVFEDYLTTYEMDGNEYYNSSKYPMTSPYFYQFAHFSEVDDDKLNFPTSCLNGTRVVISSDHEDVFSRYLKDNGLSVMKSEIDKSEDNNHQAFNIADISDEERDELIHRLSRFLNLYVSYKKTTQGIVLYVNQSNYVNSPFVRYDNGRKYSTILENTYATIQPNDSAYVDIVIQLKCTCGGSVFGIKDVTIGRYYITNVSDDKPKFIIQRVVNGNSTKDSDAKVEYIEIMCDRISLDANSDQGKEITYNVKLKSNSDKSNGTTCRLIYPADIVSYCGSDSTIEQVNVGVLNMTFTDVSRIKKLQFRVNRNIRNRTGRKYNMVLTDVVNHDVSNIKMQSGIIQL